MVVGAEQEPGAQPELSDYFNRSPSRGVTGCLPDPESIPVLCKKSPIRIWSQVRRIQTILAGAGAAVGAAVIFFSELESEWEPEPVCFSGA